MSDEANLVKWLEKAVGDEMIEGVVIGESRSYEKRSEPPLGRLLTWADAKPHLDYQFDDGFGGADCHPITAWTATRVFFVHEYDGATSIAWVPRHPVEHVPTYSGWDAA